MSSTDHDPVGQEWAEELESFGFTREQIDYMLEADRLVRTAQVRNLDELQDRMGYGVVDTAVLRDTFFA